MQAIEGIFGSVWMFLGCALILIGSVSGKPATATNGYLCFIIGMLTNIVQILRKERR